MKITADTNTLISATFWHGDSEKIITKVENKEIELVLSKEVINEYVEVLNYNEIKDKIKDKNLEMKYSVQKIISISTIIEPQEKLDIVKDDSDDNKILECAKEGHVNFIITNDSHLLNLKEFEGIKIITPKEFLNELNQY